MDVHAPHQPVHTWRDFAIHLTIVTIGLFIALSLEGLVEYVHHRHLVREARENIRQELLDNHNAVQEDYKLVQKALDSQTKNLDTLHSMMEHPGSQKKISLDYTMAFNAPSQSAWLTARDTGALSFMPYSEVKGYSSVYETQNIINTDAIAALHHIEIAFVPAVAEDLSKLPTANEQEMLHSTATNYSELQSLQQILKELDAEYVAELKK